ncbi:MAG: hypothetical protein IJI98_09160 [Methanosphaera sp.]|uniref:hypothetical protein n=1 Tax=Methanosphaera sp. ISO3-F5 TaxID=1452353 RepID=UPI002B2612CC|nr:hypothetical protein [Methanosphaera sp. ISO3-F5]MBR0472847.1 hypothetical protein [Methanosphaera sp.]WQH64277.1 hypothetical protein PXD04_00325 [Methanosphaera sp. ISO3-F5]
MLDEKEWKTFINGDLDGIPIKVYDINEYTIDVSDDPDFDFSQKLGITDYLYLDTGIDLRRLKRLNPKNHVIF